MGSGAEVGVLDIFLMTAIIGGAGYLLYRSLFRRGGACSCAGCDSCGTGAGKRKGELREGRRDKP